MKKKEKLISFVVPSYNSESYLNRCIDSLLVGKEDVEIIIVNDGSTDNTKRIASAYQKKYPSIITAVHKENGGHGSGVNKGLELASGEYFKVVDSDDWLDEESLKKLIATLKERKERPDLVVCNYVYDHLYDQTQKVMSFHNIFQTNTICTWEESKSFKKSQYLIMHSLLYKTSILKECNLKLPEHTFYVDNIVAFLPLPYVKTICYYDYDLYHYFIGRDDQSVNESVMVKRVDQQIKVTKIMLSCVDLETVQKQSPKLYKYLLQWLSMMMMISDVLLLMKKDKESLEKRKELWNFLKELNPALYKKLRYNSVAGFTYLPTKVGNFIALNGYKVAKKIYKFN